MSHSPEFWLTPAQAIYFLVTGNNLIEVTRLSHDLVMGRLGRIQSASVPLSADAGPEERAAAWKKVKEGLAAAGESPCAVAIKLRDYLLATGLVAAEGRRTLSSPYETIKPVEFCDLRFAGLHAENARGDVVFYNVRVSGSGLWGARQRAIAPGDTAPSSIESAKVPSDRLPSHAPPERSSAASGMHTVPEPESIPLIEAVHELRVICNIDLRAAISRMIGLLATGQLPMALALIDGVPTKIDPRWWYAGAAEYPNSSAAFNLLVDGEPRPTRATEIRLDRGAWERRKSQIAVAKEKAGEPFPNRDDRVWDNPVKLIDAIRLWSPALARCLDQVKWASPDDIRDTAIRLKSYDHPTRVHARRDRAKRDRDLSPESVHESAVGGGEDATDQHFPETLCDDRARLLQEWREWDDAERLVYAFELASRLILAKTKRGQPYILKYAPPATQGGLGADYELIGYARHDGLGLYDFDLGKSLIRDPGGNWLAVRICNGIDASAKLTGTARMARGEYDPATVAAWAAELEKPFRQRNLFSCVEIAEHLTRRSVAEPDLGKRDRVLLDLHDWIRRGEFDLSGESDVVLQIDESPYFRPFRPADIATFPREMAGLTAHNAWYVYLRKSACCRYIEANLELENARRILVLWFPETAPSAPRSAAAVERHSVGRERATNALLFDVVTRALNTVGNPGETVQWKPFCDHVRRECKATPETRGFGDRSIQRLVKRVQAGHDKPDKCDMS